MRKYFLVGALVFLIFAVAVLTVVLLTGSSEEIVTPIRPESTLGNDAEAAPTAITRIEVKYENLRLKPGDVQKLEFSVYPIGAGIEGLSITSSNDNIVRISNGSVEAIANGEAVISVSAENGVSAFCNIYVETPYEIKDERNIGFYELNNGEILEYCCEYKDYALAVHNMTSYQRENRTFEKNGLYVHVKGPVYKVDDAGVVYIDLGAAEDNILSPALFANITLEDGQSDLLMQLNKGDSVEAFAKLDEHSYYLAITTVSFKLYSGIIVKVNSTNTTIPQDFKPTSFDPHGESDDVPFFDSNGIGPNGYPLSNPPTETEPFPCIGSYSNGDDTITISNKEDGVLYISIADSQGIIVQGTAYYPVDDPYSAVILYTDYGNIKIIPYKPNYSIFVSIDGIDAGTFIKN